MIQTRASSLNIHFDPLLPDIWFAAIIGASLVLLTIAALKARHGIVFRVLSVCILILTLANPSLLEEERSPVRDVAILVIDQSPSQKMGQREARTKQAKTYLTQTIERRENIELRVIDAPLNNALSSETLLFEALDQALSDVPLQRRAGVIIVSDGQIHDIPKNIEKAEEYGPVHLLLSGDKQEKDRQLIVTQAPAYSLVGQDIEVKYRVEDTENIKEDYANITVLRADAPPRTFSVPVNEERTLRLPVEHAGQNIFELSVESIEGEITRSNNRTALIVNGVRDRLRVLLVSGRPHAGGRSWRDLLTSDPGVDLIHFTILRDPSKLDSTPQDELSLIAFPFRELFEVKLYDFDLIIFDRYKLNRILPDGYFDNIARYVREGGALLEASGPAFASENSLHATSLGRILPGAPNGDVLNGAFNPTLSALGQKHPVTQNLNGGEPWGDWLRQIVINAPDGDTLMTGAQDHPLLVLNRLGEGRVAQIASDHLWLWARGYDGGGPHAELLRRVVHWLMKEPELDERALRIEANGDRIIIESRNINAQDQTLTMTRPDGTQDILTMAPLDNGLFRAEAPADQLGIYTFENKRNKQKRFIVIGELNPPELRGVKSTTEKILPVLQATNGGALWLSETPRPSIRTLSNARRYSGRDWLAMRSNHDYIVQSVKSRPLLPEWAGVFLIMALIVLTWWREGRSAQ